MGLHGTDQRSADPPLQNGVDAGRRGARAGSSGAPDGAREAQRRQHHTGRGSRALPRSESPQAHVHGGQANARTPEAAFGETTLLAQITADRISKYKARRLATTRMIGATEKLLSAAAVNRPLALLRHLLRLAHDEWGVLDRVPKIRTEKEPQGRLRWLTRVEATNLLA